MPAAVDHPAVREQVRTLYYSNGRNLSQAARDAGIPIDRAEKWKERGQWDRQFDAVIEKKSAVGSVGKVAEHVAKSYADNCERARTFLSKAALNGAKAFSKLPGEALTDPRKAKALRDVTGSASEIAGGWADKGDDRRVMINIGILGS